MKKEAHPLTHTALIFLVRRCFKGPVNKRRTTFNVLYGDETPEPAVGTFRPVISHREHFSRRNYELTIHDMIGKVQPPRLSQLVVNRRCDSGKIVPVGS